MLSLFQSINEFAKNIINGIIDPFLKMPGILQLLILVGILVLCVFGIFSIANKLFRKVVAIACGFVALLIIYLILFK